MKRTRNIKDYFAKKKNIEQSAVQIQESQDKHAISQGQASTHGPPDEPWDDRLHLASDQEKDPTVDAAPDPGTHIDSEPFAAPKGPQDISQTRAVGPVQPVMKLFPRTESQGRKRRAFCASWYKDFTWLEYSLSQNSAHCFVCRHFSLPCAPQTPFSSIKGFSNWKKAMYKDGGFAKHRKAEHHINAMMAWAEYKRGVESNASLLQSMDEDYQNRVEENRSYVKTVAEVLCLTATQNIAQRGHRELEASENKGNFLAIMELIAKRDPVVKKKMTHGNAKAKYTSHTIQDEILKVLADMVRTDIVQEVRQSEAFSVLADETKDMKKQEQISLVLRYYYNGTVHESLLHFQPAEKLDAAGLTEKIINCLEQYGLQYREHLVGQGYDGASVMSGRHSGVSARIQSVAKQAFYVHCKAHCLNLVLVDTVRSVPEAHCFFSLLQRLYTFLSGSYVHQRWQEVQREMFKDQPRELPKLSDIRWACRFFSCRNLMDRLPAVLRVLHELDLENSGDRSVEARGLLGQIDLEFIGLLATFRRVLGDTKYLSDMLQCPSLDLARAVDLIEALQDTIEHYRDETYFKELWAEVVDTAQHCNIDSEVTKRQPKTSFALHGSVVTSTIGQRNCKNNQDNFRRNIFYPILDTVNAELERRFSKNNCDIMKGIQALNPTSNNFLEETPLILLGNMYNADLDSLKHELFQAKQILERKKSAGMESPDSLLKFTVFLEPFREVFHELYRLCKVAIALPVSTAACERSFSALKLIKNHLRTTMNNERVSDLGVLSVESKRAKALDMNEFIRLFGSKHGNRRIQLF